MNNCGNFSTYTNNTNFSTNILEIDDIIKIYGTYDEKKYKILSSEQKKANSKLIDLFSDQLKNPEVKNFNDIRIEQTDLIIKNLESSYGECRRILAATCTALNEYKKQNEKIKLQHDMADYNQNLLKPLEHVKMKKEYDEKLVEQRQIIENLKVNIKENAEIRDKIRDCTLEYEKLKKEKSAISNENGKLKEKSKIQEIELKELKSENADLRASSQKISSEREKMLRSKIQKKEEEIEKLKTTIKENEILKKRMRELENGTLDVTLEASSKKIKIEKKPELANTSEDLKK